MCGWVSFPFSKQLCFFLTATLFPYKTELIFWGLSWLSLRATVGSIATRKPVIFNFCLQSPDLNGAIGTRAFLAEPLLCRFCLLVLCGEARRASPVLAAPYTWFLLFVSCWQLRLSRLFPFLPFYGPVNPFCYTGNVQSFIFILMNCCWESPSLFEPNHFVSLISQIAGESITLLHNNDCSCIIKHLSVLHTTRVQRAEGEHHPTIISTVVQKAPLRRRRLLNWSFVSFKNNCISVFALL